MPWCPNCKTEYQNGFTVCKDCKVDLVEGLEEEINLIPLIQSEDKKIAEKLVRYFKYSELDSELFYDEENEMYIVSVSEENIDIAKKLYQAFYYVEQENFRNGGSDKKETHNETDEEGNPYNLSDDYPEDTSKENEDEEFVNDSSNDDVPEFEEESPTAYVMKADQYKDLSGTVWIFLFFGIVGLIIVILNIVGVLSFLNGFIPTFVMGILFLLFIYVALSTNQKAKKVHAEIEAENKLTEEINQWLEANITEEFLATLNNENISEELNYIKKLDTIKEMLLKEFGNQNLAYLDRLIDEFYEKNFDDYEEE